MILFLLAYLGGVLTILSPCILPILPFVFAQADQPFGRRAVPMLLGMALTFAAVATLAAIGGGWAVRANEYGRWAALALMALFGLTLLVPAWADRLSRPLVALGNRLSQPPSGAPAGPSSFGGSFLLGIATGLLWAPCAGPILGLVLTGAALSGANLQTSALLLAYALGAATSLALALLIGGRVFAVMKRGLGVGEWVRRGLGILVLGAVLVIAADLDRGFLTQISEAGTSDIEQALLDRIQPPSTVMMPEDNGGMMMSANAMMMNAKPSAAAPADALPVEGELPSLTGAVEWLNSPPLTAEALRGKVVLVDFWTYSCINCLRALPYVRAWAEKYKDQGLVVIGVHAPEFAFERNIDNVRTAVADLKIGYPVAIDNDYAIWRAFGNSYWPAHYFIDATGRIRHHHFGEGEYAQSEQVIQHLLAEAGHPVADIPAPIAVKAEGIQASADLAQVKSPETYIGYERAANFAGSDPVVRDHPHRYPAAPGLNLNQWTLSGDWIVREENAQSVAAQAKIAYRFHARDLHLVLGPGEGRQSVRFRVTIDGKPPGLDHGIDCDEQGNGAIGGQRLYQLIRLNGPVTDHLFTIEFIDPDAQAFAFTFG